LHSIKGSLQFNTISIDHLRPFGKAPRGHKYICLINDSFTKCIQLSPPKITNINEVIKHLKNYFNSNGQPVQIISDKGGDFTSDGFQDFVKDLDVQLVHIATGSPRANG